MWPILLAWVVVLLFAPRWATRPRSPRRSSSPCCTSRPPRRSPSGSPLSRRTSPGRRWSASRSVVARDDGVAERTGVAVLKSFGYETPWRRRCSRQGSYGHRRVRRRSRDLYGRDQRGPRGRARRRTRHLPPVEGGDDDRVLYVFLAAGAGVITAIVLAAPGALLRPQPAWRSSAPSPAASSRRSTTPRALPPR